MKAVGKVGSFISKSVYTVSGPFHPFGGAVDIIVVEQQDGSFKSSPWYVRFGKFQGVLKAKEKVVSISVNEVEADFHMYLDHKGEAYFLKELDIKKGDTLSPSSGEDTDGQSHERRPTKSKSCNFDAYESESNAQIDLGSGNVISRTNSRRSRILGLFFGRKSMKKDNLLEEENDAGVLSSEMLERAEIAADLLEVKWSTNLASPTRRKDNSSRLSHAKLEDNDRKDLTIKDGQNNVDPLIYDNIVHNLDNSISHRVIGFADNEDSKSIPTKSETSIEKAGVEILCLTSEKVTETSTVEDDDKPNLKSVHMSDYIGAADTDTNSSVIDVITEIASSESKIQDCTVLKECPGMKFQKEQVCGETLDGFNESSFPVEKKRDDRIPSFIHCETSVSSSLELDDLNKEFNGALCLSGGGCKHVYVETLQTTGVVCEVNLQPTSSLYTKKFSSTQELLGNKNDCIFSLDGKTTSSSSMENGFVTESYSQMITVQPVYASAEDIESQNIVTISTFNKSTCHALIERTICEKDQISKCESPVKPVSGPIQLNILASEISEEEQLLFGDFDDFKRSSGSHTKELVSPDCEKENDSPLFLAGTEEVNESLIPGCVFGLSEGESILVKLKAISSHINIPAPSGSQSEEVSRIARSLPNMPVHNYDFLSNVKAEAPTDNQLSENEQMAEDARSIEKLKNGLTNPAVDATDRKIGTEVEKDLPKMKVSKKKTWSITPTSEQLASLNLKDGMNSVVFTFSTPMLGKQQVDARIYLWKWDARVVISDVDGTITRSDLLGQVMPLVGVDWSQTGVAHLFSAIKENGYQLLFLSARAISQAYHTRQFLLNLKQDGKFLPEGPVVISPDGLFPSLYREVVRRAPHEFKISCLEDLPTLPDKFDITHKIALIPFTVSSPFASSVCMKVIKALFPSGRNPFYAGFGNRDTDEISYLKVGIPKGKIFIINPKGEIVVNRRVDTKSYTSLHSLVHDMFPPMSSSEQEDFNSWNYWKLPPPAIDI